MTDSLACPETTMLPGPARDALTTAIRALDLAEQNGHPALRSLALSQVARCYRGMGLLDAAEDYGFEALRWAQTLGATDQTVELMCDAAEIAVARADAFVAEHNPAAAGDARERARDYCVEAAGLAHHTADPRWEVTVLLRASDVLDRCGAHSDAIAMQCRALNLIAKDQLHQPMQVSSLTATRFLM